MFIKVLKNSGSNVFLLLVKIAITFVMTPVFVHMLGNHDYGVWEIVASIVGYMGLLDIGMRPAIVRYSAKFNAENDRHKLDALFATTLVFMTIIGVVACIFFVVWGLLWPEVLSEEGKLYERYTILLVVIGFQLLISFPGNVAEGFLEGFQKYSLKNNITIINSIIGACVIYIYIDENNGLVLLALANAIGVAIKYVVYFLLLATHRHGAFIFRPAFSSFTLFLELLTFSIKCFIQGVGYQLGSGAAPLIIGAILSPAYVMFYSIPASLSRYIQQLGWTITDVFLPLFSDLFGKNDKQNLLDVYFNYSRYVLGFLMPLAIGVFIIGDVFISIWVGEEYAVEGAIILRVMVLYYMLPFINPFAERYLTAIGKHGIIAKINPIVAAVTIGLSIILVSYIGVDGAAVAVFIPICVSEIYVLRYVCRDLGISSLSYLQHSVFPLLVPVIGMIIALSVLREYFYLASYMDIIFAGTIATIIYMILFYYFVMTVFEQKRVLLFFKNIVFSKS